MAMLTENQIFSDMKKIMSKLLKMSVEEVDGIATVDSSLRDDLGIDSVESLDFLLALEKQYSIQIADDEAATLLTVRDAIDLIQKKVS